jgi:hypothetical protein
VQLHPRRSLAALASATALVAGVLGTIAPGAQAATAPPITAGKIAMWDGLHGVELLGADRTGLHHVAGLTAGARVPNWAPDGSRVVTGSTPQGLTTGRTTDTAVPVTLPPATTGLRDNSASYDSPVYWWQGTYVVFSAGGQLAYQPSDGSYAAEPLLTDAQEPSDVSDVHPTASANGNVLAFQRVRTATSEDLGIWAYDGSTGELKQIITTGSSPVLSADGSMLAFTRQVGGFDQLFTANADGTDVKQVTTDESRHLNPTWDPAGGRLAYDDGTATKLLDPATGISSPLTATGTLPAWQPLQQNNLIRIYPSETTGIDASASHWTFDTLGAPHQDGFLAAKSAVLVNKASASTAAPAVALAAEKQGPVVLTSATTLDATAVAELQRSVPKGSPVYLDGSTATLADTVLNQVNALGYQALRLTGTGTDRYGISVRVAQQISRTPSWIFVADGADYHDPIAAAAAAGSQGFKGTGVVLLTDGKTVPAVVKNYLNAVNPETTNLVTVGSNATQAMENAVLTKTWNFWAIDGSTPAAVAANLAGFWWAAPNEATVVGDNTWENAVVGGAVSATYSPLLWSAQSSLSPETSTYLTQRAASIRNVETYGDGKQYTAPSLAGISTAIAATADGTTTFRFPGGDLPATALRSLTAQSSGTASGRPAEHVTVPGQHLNAPRKHTAR